MKQVNTELPESVLTHKQNKQFKKVVRDGRLKIKVNTELPESVLTHKQNKQFKR